MLRHRSINQLSLNRFTMKNLYLALLIFLLLPFSGNAQQTFVIEVTNFSFTPAELMINPGDTVVWNNTLGLHNVNGSLADFPNNPEGFTNGDVAMAPWTFSRVFTLPGMYNYHCAQHPNTMTGTITVLDTSSSIAEINPAPFAFFPNPVVNTLSWKWDSAALPSDGIMTLYDVRGARVLEIDLIASSSKDVSMLAGGVYSYSVLSNGRQIQSGKLLINRK